MWLNIILAVVLFITFSMLVREGLWSNALTLFNVILAALVATNAWEPVVDWIEGSEQGMRERTYYLDFGIIWVIFLLTMLVLRIATDSLSRTKVRFKLPVETVGGMVFALWTGWVLVCFTLMTLHMAPLARHSFGGAFQPTPEAHMFILAPDHQWLGLVQSLSRGALCTSSPEGSGENGLNVFDPKSEFILRYAQRRLNFEEKTDNGKAPRW